jgi:hypothetical protein
MGGTGFANAAAVARQPPLPVFCTMKLTFG